MDYKTRIKAQAEAVTELSKKLTEEMEAREQTERDLLAGFSKPDGEIQEQACIEAIKRIGEQASNSGMHSEFMIYLRDFLLDYNKN
jgi:hypothetical protein